MGSTLSNFKVKNTDNKMISIFNEMNPKRRCLIMENEFFRPKRMRCNFLPLMERSSSCMGDGFENGVMKLNVEQPENLKVTIKDGRIRIESKIEKKDENGQYFSSFQVIKSLPKYVVEGKLENKVECKFKDGQLFVKLPENKMIEDQEVAIETVVIDKDSYDKEM